MRNYGDCDDVFVLDYLCTWREGIKEFLEKGNHDSSDMIGYGYYLCREDSTEFVKDDKWDYDSFEYYDGKLTGNRRILKDISSFITGKIGLELFVHTYDIYKTELKNQMLDVYTDEGLKLAGMTDEDIFRVNNYASSKIYNMPKREQEECLKNFTCIYKKFDKTKIKQIETDFDNNIYVLTNLGKLYKTLQYEDKLEFLSDNIIKICFIDGINLYKITNENIILPIEDNEKWSNVDKYLNNNNCKYKKIETSKMNIVLLTENGNVRALSGYPNLGIIPDNFINIEDITIFEDEYEIDMPYIYKNNKWQELYIIQ